MAVIREDLVSIGFEVENNPFAELTSGINEIKAKLGILDETSSQLKDVDRSATVAGETLSDMGKGIHASPGLDETTEKTKKIGEKAKEAEVTFTGLISEMGKAGKAKLDTGVKKLASTVKKPLEGMKGLAKSSQETAAYVKKVGLPHALNAGLGKAASSAKDLAGKLKDAAGVAFGKTVGGLKSLANEAGKAAKSLGGKAWGGVKALGGKALGGMEAIGKGVAVGIGAAGAALGAGAVAAFKFGSAYETASAKTSTLVDKSKVDMQELSSDLLKLSTDTGEDAAGLQEATYQALSAGVEQDADAISNFMGVAVKAAKGGFTDTTTAVDGLTSTLNAYGMATSDAEGLANQFLITQNKGKTTFGELASSIGMVAPTANSAGVGVDQLMAGVASLTAQGAGTSEAMTGIKSALSNVIKPSGEAMKMAQSLGLEFNTAALQSKGLVGFLDDVKTATGGDADKMAKLFGSVEALNTVMALTSDDGARIMNETLAEMEGNTHALDDAYNTMTQTTEESVKRGLNSFKNLGIEIFKENEGPVKELTGLFSGAGQELYSAFQAGGFEGLTGQIGTTLSNVLTKLTSYLPQLVRSGADIIHSLIAGVMQNREQISGSVMEGLASMAMGILEMGPEILMLGGALLLSLVQGLDQQLPALLPVAMGAILNLCNGLMQNGPALIGSGISIILQLLNGLVAAAPVIFTTGAQLLVTLIQGLAGALPDLISSAIQIAGELVKSLLSIDWLKLGLDIIKGIGSGLVKGIKGLFSKGKNAGKEVGDGVSAGLDESAQEITAAADESATVAVDAMKPDTAQLSAYGVQTAGAYGSGLQAGVPTILNATGGMAGQVEGQLGSLDLTQPGFASAMSLSQGMQAGSPILTDTAGSIAGQLTGELGSIDMTQMGYQDISSLSAGMLQGSGQAIGTAQNISSMVADAAQTDIDISVMTDTSGIETFNAQASQLTENASAALTALPPVFDEAFTTAGSLVTSRMTEMQDKVQTVCAGIVTNAGSFTAALKSRIACLNLYSTGASIMSGLNRGMQSMRGTLMATASEIASSLSQTINSTLDIHSPSRVTEASGEYTDLGLIKGMRNMQGRVENVAQDVGDTTARHISPVSSRYSPEGSSFTNSTSSYSENNSYSPVFNLTLNGASASDSNERKVKRWVKEALAENNASISRKRPRLQEV